MSNTSEQETKRSVLVYLLNHDLVGYLNWHKKIQQCVSKLSSSISYAQTNYMGIFNPGVGLSFNPGPRCLHTFCTLQSLPLAAQLDARDED